MEADSIFYVGDAPPKIEGCVLHPTNPSDKSFNTTVFNGDFAGVHYGLCKHCVGLLEFNPRYQDYIDEEIKERLDKLKTQQGVIS